MTANLHKLAAGDGYLYLIRQTAAVDASGRGRESLQQYYAEKGEAPGRWVGPGLAGLGIAEGSVVTESQMKNLFGLGVHPNADTMITEAILAGSGLAAAESLTRLGQAFNVYEGTNTWRAALGAAYREFNLANGADKYVTVDDADKQAIRTQVGQELFADEYSRPPADERELTGYIARVSRPVSTAVAGYDHTFTPVKSVSALWAVAAPDVAEQIYQAHNAAVASAMARLQGEFAFTRVGARGVAQVETRGVVAVEFTHRDSRQGEPNLHTHYVVSNKIQTRDGRWLALDGRPWHRPPSRPASGTTPRSRPSWSPGSGSASPTAPPKPGHDRSARSSASMTG